MGEEYDIEKAGIEIVNLNGVAFSHFANLFNSDENKKNLQTRCSILTDDDRSDETDEISSRAQNAIDLEKNNIKVFLAEQTFEFELFIAGKNKDILLDIFKRMHPVAAKNITVNTDLKVYAGEFVKKVASNKAKSELAHQLSVKLYKSEQTRNDFTVPPYIENAIKYVIKGE